MEEDERLEAGDRDTKMRLDGEGTFKEFVMLRPLIWEEFFRRNWAITGGPDIIVDESGLVIEFAQSAECEDKVHATNETGIMLDVFPFVEGIETTFEIGAEKHGTVEVEMNKVDIDDLVDHFTVSRQPDSEFGYRW